MTLAHNYRSVIDIIGQMYLVRFNEIDLLLSETHLNQRIIILAEPAWSLV